MKHPRDSTGSPSPAGGPENSADHVPVRRGQRSEATARPSTGRRPRLRPPRGHPAGRGRRGASQRKTASREPMSVFGRRRPAGRAGRCGAGRGHRSSFRTRFGEPPLCLGGLDAAARSTWAASWGVPSSAAANAATARSIGSHRPPTCSRARRRGPARRSARVAAAPPPDRGALRRVREREMDDEAQPAQERPVHVRAQVRGQDGEAAVGLHALQQVVRPRGSRSGRGCRAPRCACRTARRPRRTAARRRAPRRRRTRGGGSSPSRRCTC